MKFNAYIVELKHRENSFTAGITVADQTMSANFKKIDNNIYIMNFKSQVEFKFLEQIAIKPKSKDTLVLLPLLSKYNKRKLAKIARFLEEDTPESRNAKSILLNLLCVEKFLKVQELLSFFAIDREELIDYFIQEEIEKNIKIIDFTYLTVMSYENLQIYINDLKNILNEYYDGGAKNIKLSEIEAKLKLPQSSLFFKYLFQIQLSQMEFPVKIQKDKLIIQKSNLSEEEKGSLTEIENILKKIKLTIFSPESIVSNSNLSQKEVNDSLWFLADNGQVIQLTDKYFIFQDEYNKIINKLRKFKRNQGDIIDIQSFRELTQLTRKYIIIIFEYFDAKKITERVENSRKILIPV